MLIERDMLVPTGEKYATDTFGEAILKGRENAEAAEIDIHFINRNIFDFKHQYLFDEITTNMPVRVSNFKDEQDQLYARFFEKSSQLLKRDGIIIMYSNESGFVKKQLRLRNDFSLKDEYCIRQKSGYYLFIIRFKG
jgi:16S rRNA G1207 methylase RsmC